MSRANPCGYPKSREFSMLKIGITGIPGSGKSTIFTAITGKEATYSSTPDVSVVPIPDERLDYLAHSLKKERIVYETMEFVDVKRESNLLKSMDVLLLVIPLFLGSGSLEGYIKNIEDEFILGDMVLCEERCKRIEKTKKEEIKGEMALLSRLKTSLERGIPLRNLKLVSGDARVIKGFTFLSIKPCIYILNLDEKQKEPELKPASVHNIRVYGEIEKEVVLAGDEEGMRMEFGLHAPLRKRVRDVIYDLKNIITFYTVVGKEARAWNVEEGTVAIEAAERIHSDIAHGFIKAEVICYDAIKDLGDFSLALKKGRVILEGKGYRIRDGDVIKFRFNL